MDEYISREALVEKITFLCELREIVCNPNDEFLRGLKNALNAVKSNELIPSEDVQLVKHGQWICEFYNDVFDVYQADCSVCKRESTDKYDKVSESYEYCPHCGAKMDLKDDDT